MFMLRALPYCLFACAMAGVDLPLAYSADNEDWNAHFQTTYVWQGKAPFSASYSGPNSLTPKREKSYSFTATAFLGGGRGPAANCISTLKSRRAYPSPI